MEKASRDVEPWNIDPSELRHRITIEQKTVSRANTQGTPGKTWSTLQLVWGKIESLSGRKLEIARQLDPLITHLVVIRYQALNAKDNRINWNGRIFNLLFLNNVEERNVRLEILCTEQVTQGAAVPS